VNSTYLGGRDATVLARCEFGGGLGRGHNEVDIALELLALTLLGSHDSGLLLLGKTQRNHLTDFQWLGVSV